MRFLLIRISFIIFLQSFKNERGFFQYLPLISEYLILVTEQMQIRFLCLLIILLIQVIAASRTGGPHCYPDDHFLKNHRFESGVHTTVWLLHGDHRVWLLP